MKKLQNNFTTAEQSKRLLELGVPADSADCYIENDIIKHIPQTTSFIKWKSIINVDIMPCWSVGRLMEIFDKCKTPRTDCYRDWVEYTTCDDYIELIISAFNRWNSTLDFSKLED